MINQVTLLGHLGRDVEIRALTDGSKVANLSIATSESWKDKKTDEWKDRTEWHRVTVFGDGLVGFLQGRATKGRQVYINGKLRTRKFRKDGQDHYATEIVIDRQGVFRFVDKVQSGEDREPEPEEQDEAPKAKGGKKAKAA